MTTASTAPMPEVRRGSAGLVPPRAPDRANTPVAVLVGAAILAVYGITLSPDTSFWDSGEFIATSWSLGIPHPPGTPLYVLCGRFFAILFHSALGLFSVAQSVNLLSAIPSALAAVFLYLAVVRIGKKVWGDGSGGPCLPATLAGVTAALFAAFSNTLWINSIEAEVYAVSGMWAALAAWLVLVWADSEPKDERLLVVVAYLLSLNIGVHLATYLAALAILPFAFLHERRLALPISLVVVLTMAKDLQFFLVVVALLILPTLQLGMLPAEYTKRHRATLLTMHGLAVVLALWGVLEVDSAVLRRVLAVGAPVAAFLTPWLLLPAPKRFENPFTDLGFLLTLVTVLGFSCHLYLPIRSALDPAINEAQPDNWTAFWDVILRAQYRPPPFLDRQATWVFQFDHMFWRYFREQWNPSFLAWVLGVPGLVLHWRRHPRSFVLVGLLFVWTSLALVLKMNFTDHEVRERDYFFAPGFFWYAVWMGMGLGWLADTVLRGFTSGARRPLAFAVSVLCVLVAALPVRGGWATHDRRGNWVAHDYAYNMLVALEPDAVLFTNGDNDTFPLWYLQEVHGFRKDVRIVNLSLLNTPWYGAQLRDEEPKVPMNYTTEQLWKLRPVQDPQTGRIHWVKDLVTNDIVNAVFEGGGEKKPVYFAVTVDDLMDLDPYLALQGLVFRLDPGLPEAATRRAAETGSPEVPGEFGHIVDNVDLATTRRNLEEVYRYRGLLREDGTLDPDVHRDENDEKLCTNYAAAWARMALAYRGLKDTAQAVECMQRAVAIAPDYDPIVSGLGGLLLEAGRYDEAEAFYRERERIRPDDLRVYLGLGYLAQRKGNTEEALEWYLRGLRVDPYSQDLLASLFSTYYELGRLEDAENVLQRWVERNPTDQSARERLEQVRRERQARAGGGTTEAGG